MRTLPRSASLLLLLAGCSETSTDEPTVIRTVQQNELSEGLSQGLH